MTISANMTTEVAEAQLRLLRLLQEELLSLHPSQSGLVMGLKCAFGAGIATQEVVDALETSRSTLARWERGIGIPHRPLELAAMFDKLKGLFTHHIDLTERCLDEISPDRPGLRGDAVPRSASPG